MRKEIVEIILIILALNLFLASTTFAPPTTTISVDPSLIQDKQIKPGAPILGSYPSADVHNASVTGDVNVYDKNPTTWATISPASGTTTTWYYFGVNTFNSSLTKQYIALDLNINYSVTAYRGAYRFVYYVGSTRVVLDAASTVNVTTPTVRTWATITEPNDGLWSQADINNLDLRVEVRRTQGTTGWCTFKEYEAWVSIPSDSFSVRINISDVTQMVLWQVNLTYNPSVLEVVTVGEGPFLKSVHAPPPQPDPGTNFVVSYGPSSVQAVCVLKSYNYGGATGSGVLATFHFRAIAEGNSDLNISAPETYLFTWAGDPPELVDIPCSKVSGYFQYLAGDVDSDGDVDYDDFIVLAGAYGSSLGQPAYKANADFDHDGDVDYDDFIALAGNYGKT